MKHNTEIKHIHAQTCNIPHRNITYIHAHTLHNTQENNIYTRIDVTQHREKQNIHAHTQHTDIALKASWSNCIDLDYIITVEAMISLHGMTRSGPR